MNRSKESILDFLLTADFRNYSGYSYTELIEYLNYYQTHYKQIRESNNWIKNELERRDKSITELNLKVETLEHKMEFQDRQIQFLKSHLNKRLSIWERITGKSKM